MRLWIVFVKSWICSQNHEMLKLKFVDVFYIAFFVFIYFYILILYFYFPIIMYLYIHVHSFTNILYARLMTGDETYIMYYGIPLSVLPSVHTYDNSRRL